MQLVQPRVIFGVPWPGGPKIQFSKAELATLAKAADILERLRAAWPQNDDADNLTARTDVALAMYTLRELVEDGGFES